ncbi:hypothetical protein [Microvirga subterranea]|uniref:ElaB/YqjD/DUF883 family membrane-anchored ribosome-binding protein n=1 Tax=Microvirga subterranea TaxID=186651 RepID=A0A370HR90_9HYPH|nr:hypothetical protein [Microvirga subterranea]RDI61062.1 hypothetical protein DES45_102456 [Microvirga subterranea]
MPGRENLHQELRTLRDELGRRAQSEAVPPMREAAPDLPKSAASGQWQELEQALSEIADNAEEAVAKHPLAAVLGAFVLGAVIGRLTGRGKA